MAAVYKAPAVLLGACILLLAAAPALAATEPPVRYRAKLPALSAGQFTGPQEVNLYVETNAYGFVTRSEVLSTTDSALGEICAEAVRNWRYAPAREYGQPVPARFVQPICFCGKRLRASAAQPLPSPQIPESR
jgi:hypothetical protein